MKKKVQIHTCACTLSSMLSKKKMLPEAQLPFSSAGFSTSEEEQAKADIVSVCVDLLFLSSALMLKTLHKLNWTGKKRTNFTLVEIVGIENLSF